MAMPARSARRTWSSTSSDGTTSALRSSRGGSGRGLTITFQSIGFAALIMASALGAALAGALGAVDDPDLDRRATMAASVEDFAHGLKALQASRSTCRVVTSKPPPSVPGPGPGRSDSESGGIARFRHWSWTRGTPGLTGTVDSLILERRTSGRGAGVQHTNCG